MLAPEQIADINERADCADLARQFGATLRRSGRKWIGSCPLCGGGAKATRFEADRAGWVCAACSSGGDAIALVRAAKGCDFRAAVEALGGPRVLSEAERDRLARERAAREETAARAQAEYRAAEIERCRAIWRTAAVGDLSEVAAYLAGRGIDMPQPFFGRSAAVMPYFHGETIDEAGRRSPRVVHRGPAMLAALVSPAGAFCGLHITWIDPARPGKKAAIFDPETGDPLPAKKMRGSALGSHIRLSKCERPVRVFLGEGIETVLSARMFLRRAGRLRETDAFWAAGSLGNLGGPHAGTIAHPSLTTATGRPQRAPSATPAFDKPSIPLPDSVEEVVLLGDGDSDPFTTRLALERAVARYSAPPASDRAQSGASGKDSASGQDSASGKDSSKKIHARFLFAVAGEDFNDMLRRAWA